MPDQNSSFGKCEKCPLVMHCGETVAAHRTLIRQAGAAAMDPAIDELLGHELAAQIRAAQGYSLESLAEAADQAEEFLATITNRCPGPLEMKAAACGTNITALVCNSPQAPDGFNCEKTHLYRDRDHQ